MLDKNEKVRRGWGEGYETEVERVVNAVARSALVYRGERPAHFCCAS